MLLLKLVLIRITAYLCRHVHYLFTVLTFSAVPRYAKKLLQYFTICFFTKQNQIQECRADVLKLTSKL